RARRVDRHAVAASPFARPVPGTRSTEVIMKSVSGLFDSYAEAKHAVDDLMIYGTPANRISIVASDLRGEYTATRGDGEPPSGTAAGAVTGGLMGGAAGVAVGLTGLTIPLLGPVIA